jgi:uridine kinase
MRSSSVDAATAAIRRTLSNRRPRNGAYPTVAIDGRGASGKSTLAAELATRLPSITVIHGDDYFEPHDDPITWGAFNEVRFERDVVQALRSGAREIPLRPYDYAEGRVVDLAPRTVEQCVVVERCFSFSLDVPWDLTIWVDAPAATCLERGLRRDADAAPDDRAERAWRDVWQPAEDRYIAATNPLSAADIVVLGS